MQQIGEGFFSKVYKLNPTTILKRTSVINVIELDILFRVNHPNIIHGIDFYFENDDLCILMPYIQRTNITNPHNCLLQSIPIANPHNCLLQSIPIANRHNCLLQLTSAVHCLHSQHICHRDIRPSNIIFDGDNLYLIDFGLAETDYLQKTDNSNHIADYKRSDIFNLACVFVYILTEQQIFSFEDVEHIEGHIENFVKDIPNNLMKFGLTSSYYELILRMFVDKDCNTSNLFNNLTYTHIPDYGFISNKKSEGVVDLIDICFKNNFHISVLFFSVDLFYRISSLGLSGSYGVYHSRDIAIISIRLAIKLLYNQNYTQNQPEDPYKNMERKCLIGLKGKLLYDNYYTSSQSMNQLISAYPLLLDAEKYQSNIADNNLLGCSKDIYCEQFLLNLNTV